MQQQSVWMALVLSAALGLGGAAQAAGFSQVAGATGSSLQAKKNNAGTPKPRKARGTKKSKSSVTFHDGSAESRSERDRRLLRECKGRSNSGVCEGYTR